MADEKSDLSDFDRMTLMDRRGFLGSLVGAAFSLGVSAKLGLPDEIPMKDLGWKSWHSGVILNSNWLQHIRSDGISCKKSDFGDGVVAEAGRIYDADQARHS